MAIVRIFLMIVAGALSVALTEVCTSLILLNAPLDLDLTANLFVSVIVPSVLLVHLIMAFVFWKAFEPEPVRNSLIFIAAHAGLQSVELVALNNPLGDVVSYLTIIVLSGSLVTFVFRRYFWCPACAQIPKQ